MAYIEIIEADTTWECPADGLYKVICVGAGANGSMGRVGGAGEVREKYFTFEEGDEVNIAFNSGGKTLFGTFSASNGATQSVPALSSSAFSAWSAGGEGGYTLDGVYGGAGAAVFRNDDTETTYLPVTLCSAGASKNGGQAGCPGSGFGAGGGSSYFATESRYTSGRAGAVIIRQIS